MKSKNIIFAEKAAVLRILSKHGGSFYAHFFFWSKNTAATAVIPSAAGKESQIPVMPNTAERRNAIGMITPNPRRNATICAGTARSTAASVVERRMLTPAKTAPVK